MILGAGISGLAAGLLLARDGHEVEILERDGDPVPAVCGDAWEHWARDGVKQFHQAHYLQPRGREVLQAELPDVLEALCAAGAARVNPLSAMPPSIADRSARPGDERLETVTARRPLLEHVVAGAAEAQPGLTVRRGTAVTGLLARRRDAVPQITGVRTQDGGQVTGDLVVDAMGRRSPLPAWLADVGARPMHEEAEDSGFTYYTRFFRATDAGVPALLGPMNTPMGTVSVLTLPADNDCWSVTLYCSSGDRPLKRMRHPECFAAVLAACPRHAHWIDGEPITPVQPMAGVTDRRRRLVVDGAPVATGIALLGDAWGCTNPSLGRGLSLALLHASRLRDVVRATVQDPRAFAEAWDEATEAELGAWYRDTVDQDRGAVRRMDRLREGRTAPARADPAAALRAALPIALMHDADVFRTFLENRCCITTMQDAFARPGMAERVLAVAGEHEAPAPIGPDRERLLALLDETPVRTG